MTLSKSWGFLGSDYPGVGGGTPTFSYIFRFRAFFWSKYFCEYEDLWIYFFEGGGGHYEIGLFFGGGDGGSFLYILGLFKVKIQNGNIFCKYLWVCLIFLISLRGLWG